MMIMTMTVSMFQLCPKLPDATRDEKSDIAFSRLTDKTHTFGRSFLKSKGSFILYRPLGGVVVLR